MDKKVKKVNRFDALVGNLVNEFTKVKNIDLLLTDDSAKRAFSIVTYRIAEITSYKELVCSHFFPATNKAIHLSKIDFINSSYKHLLTPEDIDFSETINDTVRLSYVGLFHKLENFINEVCKLPEVVFSDLLTGDKPVHQWAKERFSFDMKDWRRIYIANKINWICNCVKHKDGYPVKEPKPAGFESVDECQRIKISTDEFKSDCDSLIKFYPIYIQLIFMFSQHKFFIDNYMSPENLVEFPDLVEDKILAASKFDGLIRDMIDAITF
ncbi:hypothetical protein [Chitinophaga sp.]|uniref:hypothetical protein n=1 Tax=Chitinophaga sp. TaxID=1869181 RepID=UPI0031CDD8E8